MDVNFPPNEDQVSRQKAKDYQRKAKLLQAQTEKKRTHRLCEVGGHLEKVFDVHGWPMEITKAVLDALKDRNIYGEFSEELEKIKKEVVAAAAAKRAKAPTANSLDAPTTVSTSTAPSAYDTYKSEIASTPTTDYSKTNTTSYTPKTDGTTGY